MGYPLQKIQIAERLINFANDVLVKYRDQYGCLNDWDSITLKTFLLNCDTEIYLFLEKNNIKWHEDVETLGPTYSISIIRSRFIIMFNEKYGDTLDMYQKASLNKKVNMAVYNYIVNGLENGN